MPSLDCEGYSNQGWTWRAGIRSHQILNSENGVRLRQGDNTLDIDDSNPFNQDKSEPGSI